MERRKKELLERQFMNEMVTPKMRTMETDNEIENYVKKLESRMWKALGIAGIIMFTAILIALIVYK